MKKIDLASAVLALLLIFTGSQMLGSRVRAQDGDGDGGFGGDPLTCSGMSCCGTAGCLGPGTPNGCAATCSGGGTITCKEKNSSGGCSALAD